MIDILCIGTPRVIGDAVGPLVGTVLTKRNIKDVQVIGTIKDPVIRSTYFDKIKLIRPDSPVIVVDAAIGKAVGTYRIVIGSLIPGLAIAGDSIDPVGDISIKCYTAKTENGLLFANKLMVMELAFKVSTKLTTLLTKFTS